MNMSKITRLLLPAILTILFAVGNEGIVDFLQIADPDVFGTIGVLIYFELAATISDEPAFAGIITRNMLSFMGSIAVLVLIQYVFRLFDDVPMSYQDLVLFAGAIFCNFILLALLCYLFRRRKPAPVGDLTADI